MNRARRKLAGVLGVVLLAGAGGWYAGQQVRSPAEAAAARKPPPASLITVPVESRILTNSVVAHGSVTYESPVPITLSGAVGTAAAPGGTGEGGAAQRVTRAPAAGASVVEGAVFMEVSGRPVFVLRGAVPMYRTLGPGAKGADVKQLNEALKRIGFDPGTSGDTFTSGTGSALKRWYQARGYEAKEPGTAERQQLASLEQAVQTATEALAAARAELQAARTPNAPTPGASATSGKSTGGTTAGGTAPTDTAMLRQRVANAEKALGYAQQNLTDFRAGYGTSLPAGELVFLAALPVRVDEVGVRPGDAPSAQVAKVTGTGVRVQTTVPGIDAQLLRPGLPVSLEFPDGQRLPGTVDAVGAAAAPEPQGGQEGGQAGEGGGKGGDTPAGGQNSTGTDASSAGVPTAVRIVPTDPTTLAARAGQAVKATVEVGSTGTPVLAVPIAAVFTGADGQARVKVERPDGTVEPVAVTLGLAAGGFVAITPSDGRALAANDRVAVGEK